MHLLALQVCLNGSQGQPTYNNVLKMDPVDQEEWYNSMDKEITILYKHNALQVVDRGKALNHQIVPSTWALKVKTFPDGSVMKKKSCLCIRGDLMLKGLHKGELAAESSGYTSH